MIRKQIGFFAAVLFCVFFNSLLSSPVSADLNDDGTFLQEALNSAVWLGALGELAGRQAASEGVRRFGEDLAAHCRGQIADIELLAKSLGLSPVAQISGAGQSTLNYFSSRRGADFDRHFISLMVDENRFRAQAFADQAQSGSVLDIKTFALKERPIFENFAARAQDLLIKLPRPVLK